MKATWILTGVLILGVLAVPAVLGFVYSEVKETQAGTLDYWLGIPDDVKSVPVVRACGRPLYGAIARSGATPAYSRMTYQTEASVAHVTAVIRGHFEAEGCAVQDDGATNPVLQCPDARKAAISVIENTPCNIVSVNVSDSGES